MKNESKPLTAVEVDSLIRQLAGRLVWVAPVGHDLGEGFCNGVTVQLGVRGFMVCKRSFNNVDRPSSRVDYLLVKPGRFGCWKKPFSEDKCMFPTMDAALMAAAKSEEIE